MRLSKNMTQSESTASCKLLKITNDIRILRHKNGDYSCCTPCTAEKAEVSFGKQDRQRTREARPGTAHVTSWIVDSSVSITLHCIVL